MNKFQVGNLVRLNDLLVIQNSWLEPIYFPCKFNKKLNCIKFIDTRQVGIIFGEDVEWSKKRNCDFVWVIFSGTCGLVRKNALQFLN